ncbi:MAG: TPR end-of-group domain-containing protein [Chloroflexota bacterium]
MIAIDVKTIVVELLHLLRKEEVGLVAGLSAAERVATGDLQHMSGKDLIAHLSAARQREAHRLAIAADGGVPCSDDHDAARIFKENQHRAWPDVQDEAEHMFVEFVHQVERFPEADLVALRRYDWLHGRPLCAEILGYGVRHPLGHMTEFYRRHGETERVRQIYTGLLEGLSRSNLLDVLREDGLSLYNLACAYAVTGQPKKALELLPAAIKLDPELLRELKRDSDLDALRGDPVFQAMEAA